MALDLLLADGLEAAWERSRRLALACRAGVKALGLELFSPDEDRSAVVTAIRVPDGVDGRRSSGRCASVPAITIAGGQGELKGKIVRIGHIGYVGLDDVAAALEALGLALAGAGVSIDPGAGPEAARDAYAAQCGREGVTGDGASVRECSSVSGSPRRASSCCGSVSTSTWISTATSTERIAAYDALIVRSATTVTAELLERADAAQGDRPGGGRESTTWTSTRRRSAAFWSSTRRSPPIVSAAEHTIGLLLALARSIPQAHAALKEGRWERARFAGIEVAEKTLGIVGFGRIGQQVARRARGPGDAGRSPSTRSSLPSGCGSRAWSTLPRSRACSRPRTSSPCTPALDGRVAKD